MIIYNQSDLMMLWASEKLGRSLIGPQRVAVGVIRDHELVAAVVWSEFKWPDIHASIVSTSPRWATRGHLREILHYPFIQLGCKRVTAVTDATNQSVRSFLCRIGFRQEGVHVDANPTGDAVSYGLLAKDAARWLAEEDHEQRQSVHTAGS